MVQRPYKRTKYKKPDPEFPDNSQRPDRKGNRKQSTGFQSLGKRKQSVAAGGHRVSLEGQKRTWRKAIVVTAPTLWSVCHCLGHFKGVLNLTALTWQS